MSSGKARVAETYLRMPHVEAGMAVGLFGGSFDPPHAGHRLVADLAMRRLGLDRLWWMVTPQNPLKARREDADLAGRIARSEAVADDPRIDVTAFEAAYDLRYSADTVRLVLERNPGVRFVWIMGADNLNGFHRWERWRFIVESIPIAVIDRPGSTMALVSAPMARIYAGARLDERDARLLARRRPPAWVFLHGPRSPLSSTALRAARAIRDP